MAQLKDSIVTGDFRITDTLYSNKIANSMRTELIYENASGDEIVPGGLGKTFTTQPRQFLQLTIGVVNQYNQTILEVLNISYGPYYTNIVFPWYSYGEMIFLPIQILYEKTSTQISLVIETGDTMGLKAGQNITSHSLSDLQCHVYLYRVVGYWFE